MPNLRPLHTLVWKLACLVILLAASPIAMAAGKTSSADLEKLQKQSVVKGNELVAKCDADLAKLADILDRAKKGNSSKVGEIEKAIEKVAVARSFYKSVLKESDVRKEIGELEAVIHAGRRQGKEPSEEQLASLSAKRTELEKAVAEIKKSESRYRTIAGDNLQTPMMQLYLASMEKDGKDGR